MRTSIQTPLRIAAALATLAAATLPTAAPAQAAGKTSAICVNQFTVTISPGFTLVPSSGTQTTHGETGTLTCVGKIKGHRITGPGSSGFDMPYNGATCASEKSSGTVSGTIPTTAGSKHFVGALTVWRTALAFRVEAQFPGMHFSGAGVDIPRQGNCILTPLRQATAVLTGTFSGA